MSWKLQTKSKIMNVKGENCVKVLKIDSNSKFNSGLKIICRNFPKIGCAKLWKNDFLVLSNDLSILYLSTKLWRKRAKMESCRRSHGSRVERISAIGSSTCQTLIIHCIQFRVLLLNLWGWQNKTCQTNLTSHFDKPFWQDFLRVWQY